MEQLILIEEYYGHIIEVTIIETNPVLKTKLEFIPDVVKESIFNELANNSKDGTFAFDNGGDTCAGVYTEYTGSWRIQPNLDIQENHISSFFYYMWNAWCKDECKLVFRWEFQHFWDKWSSICSIYKVYSATEKFYAELTTNNRIKLVNRACELFDGSKRK